jgi:hypothetical protein
MRWQAIDEREGRRFIIREDPGIGFYLYVYEGAACIADHLQDSVEAAMAQAEEDYGVARCAWASASGD